MRPTSFRAGAFALPRLIAGLFLAACVYCGGEAQAQPFRTLGDGLNFGRTVIYPSIAFGYTRDGNVFYSSRDLPDAEIVTSGVMIVRPRILMDLPIGVNRVRWVYSPLYRNYTSQSFEEETHFSHFFDFEAVHTGPLVTVRAADHVVLGTVELREVDRGGEAVFGLTPFKSYGAEAEVTLSMGARSSVSLVPQYAAVSFDEDASAAFFSYRRKTIDLRFQHAVSLASQIYTFYSLDGTEQEREQVIFGEVTYDARTVGAGLRRVLNQEVVAFVNAGYKTMDFKGGSRSNYRGPVFDANTNWQIGDATALGLTAAHQAYQSFYVNNNYYIDSEFRLRMTHQIGRSLVWNFSLGLMNNHYADPLDNSVTPDTPADMDCLPMVPDPGNPGKEVCGGDGRIDVYESLQPSVGRRRRDRLYQAEIGATWQISRTLRLFIGYNSDRRRSNIEQLVSGQTVDPFDYRVSRMVFQIEAGWL